MMHVGEGLQTGSVAAFLWNGSLLSSSVWSSAGGSGCSSASWGSRPSRASRSATRRRLIIVAVKCRLLCGAVSWLCSSTPKRHPGWRCATAMKVPLRGAAQEQVQQSLCPSSAKALVFHQIARRCFGTIFSINAGKKKKENRKMQPKKLPRSTRVNVRGQPGQQRVARQRSDDERLARALAESGDALGQLTLDERISLLEAELARRRSRRRYTATPRVQPRGRRGHSRRVLDADEVEAAEPLETPVPRPAAAKRHGDLVRRGDACAATHEDSEAPAAGALELLARPGTRRAALR